MGEEEEEEGMNYSWAQREGGREGGRHAKAGGKEEGGILRCQCYVHTHGKAQNNNPSLLGRRALGLSRGMVFRILEHSGLFGNQTPSYDTFPPWSRKG